MTLKTDTSQAEDHIRLKIDLSVQTNIILKTAYYVRVFSQICASEVCSDVTGRKLENLHFSYQQL